MDVYFNIPKKPKENLA